MRELQAASAAHAGAAQAVDVTEVGKARLAVSEQFGNENHRVAIGEQLMAADGLIAEEANLIDDE